MDIGAGRSSDGSAPTEPERVARGHGQPPVFPAPHALPTAAPRPALRGGAAAFDGLAELNPGVPLGLTRLPAETTDLIASHLPSRDLLRLAFTCQSMHGALQERLLGEAICTSAYKVASFGAVQGILNATQQLLRRSLHVRPLMALACRSARLPPGTQPAAFAAILERTRPLTDAQRAAVLTELAGLAKSFPPEVHAPRFDELFEELERLEPELRGTLLSALAARLPDVSAARSNAAFHRVLEAAAVLGPKHAASIPRELMPQVQRLPGDHRAFAFLQALASFATAAQAPTATGALPTTQATQTGEAGHAPALVALLVQLGRLPPQDRLGVLQRIVAVSQRLSMNPHVRGTVLNALAQSLLELEQEAERAWLFQQILQTLTAVPPECRRPALMRLCWGAVTLAATQRTQAFRALAHQAQALAPAAQGTILAALAGRLAALPVAHRRATFDALIGAAEPLAVRPRLDVLLTLDSRLDTLPVAEQVAAGERIAAAMRQAQASQSECEPISPGLPQPGAQPSLSQMPSNPNDHTSAQPELAIATYEVPPLSGLAALCLADLPFATRAERLINLSPRAEARVRTASRQMCSLLEEQLKSAELCILARTCVSFQMAMAVLESINALPTLRLRVPPLSALARRGAALGYISWEPVFFGILKASQAIPGAERPSILSRLTEVWHQLPRTQQGLAFGHLLAAFEAVPIEWRGRLLARLAVSMPAVSAAEPTRAFARILQAAAPLSLAQRSPVLRELPRQIGALLREKRDAAFDTLLREAEAGESNLRGARHGGHEGAARSTSSASSTPSERLDEESRGVILAALSGQLGELPAERRPAMFDRILAASRTLCAPYRAETLRVLAWQFGRALPPEMRLDNFVLLLETTSSLPCEYRLSTLTAISWAASDLAGEERTEAFRWLATAGRPLPPAAQALLLKTLVSRLTRLPPPQRTPLFADLTYEASRLRGEPRHEALCALRLRAMDLEPAARAQAFQRIAALSGNLQR